MVAWTTPIRLNCVLWCELLLVNYLQVRDLYEQCSPTAYGASLQADLVVIASACINYGDNLSVMSLS